MANVIDVLIAEAGGEGDKGLIAAAWAISQRAAARGQTIEQVVKSGFDGYSHPGAEARRAQQNPATRARVQRILDGVSSGSIPNPVPGADHFLSGNASPSWSKGMKLVATIGGHRFYASGNVPQSAYGRLVPPGELPEVGTLTDTVPSRAMPVTPSPNMRLLRSMTPATQGGSGSDRARGQTPPLPRPRPQTAPPDLIARSISSLLRPPAPGLNLGDRLAMSPIPGGPMAPPMMDARYDREQGVMALPTSATGEMPTLAATRAAFGLSPAQNTTRRPPVPALPSPQLAGRRAVDRNLQVALNSRYPTRLPKIPPSTIGQPPSTRSVASIPMPAMPPVRQAPPQSYALQDRVIAPASGTTRTAGLAGSVPLPPGVRPTVPSITPTRPAIPRSYAGQEGSYRAPTQTAQNIPGPDGYTIVNKPQDRLAASNGLPFDTMGASPTAPGVPPIPRPTLARTKMPLPAQPYRAVGTDLAVRPLPALPRPRPDLGMGGMDIEPTNNSGAGLPSYALDRTIMRGSDGLTYRYAEARKGQDGPSGWLSYDPKWGGTIAPNPMTQNGAGGPMPMPRLDRPGIFGRPQIFGHDIKVPGILGVIQNATHAMANSSGPFNNGADNSLYSAMRGGDFNTPGAATHQSGGYLFAPRPGGGFINVGRVNPAQSGAALYDSLNRRNDSADDAANRVNGRNSGREGGAYSGADSMR